MIDRNAYDEIRDAPGMGEHSDEMRLVNELLTEYKNLRETKIFAKLASMSKDDEDEAIERLIENDNPDAQRAIIQRCRYFNSWVLSLEEYLIQDRTEHDPSA